MTYRLRHIALVVPDVVEAEAHYAALFGMSSLFRQVERDGQWVTLAAGEADVPEMAALQRDDLILALFAGNASGEQLHAIGLFADEEEIAAVASRLGPGARLEARATGWLAFVDRYGLRWQLSTRPYGPRPPITR